MAFLHRRVSRTIRADLFFLMSTSSAGKQEMIGMRHL